MKLTANISIGSVCRGMGLAQIEGATVAYANITIAYKRGGELGIVTFRRKGGDRLLVESAEVDKDEVLELLAEDDYHFDEDGDFIADSGDVHDFVAACMTGDRSAALALAPRLFSGENELAAERALRAFPGRRAA